MIENAFGGIYGGRKVLVTGHTGFKGSWLCLWLRQLGATVMGYSLPSPTDPNHFGCLGLDMTSIIADIRDLPRLSEAVASFQPEIVFHLAAQPIVRTSYEDPVGTYHTNVLGTLHVCEAVRSCPSVRAVVAITTDKVYENREWDWGYRETDRLGGHDPYSSSTAAAEILLASYRNSFFPLEKYGAAHNVLLSVVRAGNVIGGGDWSKDRLIPDIVKARTANEKVIIRNPRATRPWQHVLECLSGYLVTGQRLLLGDRTFATSFNFGPVDEDACSVGEVVQRVAKYWPALDYEIRENPDAPHEARYLKLDCSRSRSMLRWRPVWGGERAFERTIGWYREYCTSGAVNSIRDLDSYVGDAQEKGIAWAG